jgi:SprT protein
MNEMIELQEATTQWLTKANQIFGRTFPMPMISLRLRGGVAGRANASLWLVKYNPEIYINNKQAFIDRTVPHELAHLINRTINGNLVKTHGKEWRSIMRQLGVKDITRCHSYNIEGIKVNRERPFVYTCSCKEWKLTSLIHRKILMGQNRRCPHCRDIVVFLRTEVGTEVGIEVGTEVGTEV